MSREREWVGPSLGDDEPESPGPGWTRVREIHVGTMGVVEPEIWHCTGEEQQ
ncbi:hypothetical protein Q5424_08180 [Conexibacter sp. JD483]|uniref:hypothetical protein n=1 Tax=unclassified Conexibacter TaxID=2627773 RepID=UPI002723B144|nr:MULTISPECIES: hypothetical protein [unclassified Conexibacter]MDO8183984.1 hypothetical protein [Conexibacter sp. CPCC 205706]MDO8196976.1 hypothetical protein [Conexibacter sp. CPCC 205762]MDR9369054.1 hypothetical protein [Conexibacter sp. JD483]